ncbi:MAG: hypothetical protein ACI9JM_000793 [Halioglobus sp.]|jgi:hypothetical protein
MRNISTLKAIGLAALLLAPLSATAQVNGQANAADGYTAGYAFDLDYNGVDCATNPSDCGTLMVKSSGGTVQMALILPTSLKDNTYGDNSTDYPGKDGQQTFKALTGSDKLKIDLNGNLLAMDFLHGIGDKDDGPVFISGFTGNEDSPAPGSEPSWALAAATSMEFNYLASSPDGLNAPAHFGDGADSPGAGDAALAFWEFQHVYEWEVDESIFENGTFSIEQVSITDIHLSPKKEDINTDPPIEDCPPDDPNGCLPPPNCTPGDPGCTPPTDVPLPGTLVLMLMGLAMLTGRRVARRKAHSTVEVTNFTG